MSIADEKLTRLEFVHIIDSLYIHVFNFVILADVSSTAKRNWL